MKKKTFHLLWSSVTITVDIPNLIHRLHGGRFCRFGWHQRATLDNDRVCLWCLDGQPRSDRPRA